MTKSTEQPRTRGHHTTTFGAQMLEPSFKYLRKIRTEAEKTKTENDLKFKDRSREVLPPKTFKEFQEAGEAAGMHRENRSTKDARIPQCTLEPNHSHFIFADDGSLNYGTEFKLRADVLSCFSLKQADVLSFFKGVGVQHENSQQMGEMRGGKNKILHRIDDEITRMLVHKLKRGWENAEISYVDREVSPCSGTLGSTGVKCHRWIWKDQTKCGVCLSNEAIKEKLKGNASPAPKSIDRASVIALKHFFSNQFKDPIKIESNQKIDEIEKQIKKHEDLLDEIKRQIEKHKDALTGLSPREGMDSSPDLYAKAQILKSMLYSNFL
jgi:hypothetical protein